jgi:hypothetical protein
MTQRSEVTDYADLKREVDALRKKIEEIESGDVGSRITARATRWGWLSRKSAFVLTAVVVVGLLAVLGLGAENKPSALFIDEKGNVGINTMHPEQTLDVNGDAVFRQPVTVDALTVTNNAQFGGTVTGPPDGLKVAGNTTMSGQLNLGNSDLYFTKTDHDHSGAGNKLGYAALENASNYKSLMIMGRMIEDSAKNKSRDITMWDRVAIGKTDPKTPLDVKGEIRGKPWYSQEYEWKQGQAAVRMTRVDRTVCFLTLVAGYFYGDGEVLEVGQSAVNGNTYWTLGGKSQTRGVRAKARCIGAPDDAW